MWERKYHNAPGLDEIELTHKLCRSKFWPKIQCSQCPEEIVYSEVFYIDAPGASNDIRPIKTRRRASQNLTQNSASIILYKNFVELLGDRWTANIINLSFHRLKRFDEFLEHLPIATNILSNRLKFLTENNILYRSPYQTNPIRYEYLLTDKGQDLFPSFLLLSQWGDKWCNKGAPPPTINKHGPCGKSLFAEVVCSECGEALVGTDVDFS